MATEPVKASVRLLRRVPAAPASSAGPATPVAQLPPVKPAPATPAKPEPKSQPTIDELLVQGVAAGRARGDVVKDQVLVIDNQKAELQAQQKKVSDLISKLELSQDGLKSSVAAKKKQLAALEARGGVLENVRQKYEQEIAKDEAALIVLEGKLATLRAESARLDGEAKKLSGTHRTSYDKATDAENYLKYLESVDPGSIPDEAKKKAEQEAKSREAAAAREQLKKTESAIGENKVAKKENGKAQGQVSVDVASTRQMIGEEKEALGATEKELSDVKEKSRELKAKTQSQLGLIEANERALKSAHGRISSIQDEIGSLETKRKALIDAAIKANNKDIDSILKQLDGLEKTAGRLKTQLKDAEADLQEALSHRDILEAGKAALENDAAVLQERISKLLGDKKITLHDIAGARSDVTSAKGDIDAMGKKDKLLVEHGNGLSDDRFKLLEEQKALEELATLPPEKLSEADKERLKNRQDLSGRIDELTRRIQAANGKRGNLAKELEKRMADIKAATAKIEASKVKLSQIEVDIQEGRKSQDITEEELKQTEADLKEATAVIEQAIGDQKAIRDALVRLDAQSKALKDQRTALVEDNKELQQLKK